MSARLSTTFSHGREKLGTTRRPPARSIALAVLVGVTSLAIGQAFSWWLVPGYLILISWLLMPPRAEDRAEAGTAHRDAPPAGDRTAEPPGESSPDVPSPAPDAAETPPRSRKRSRKPKPKPAPEPPESAVWIRVGPGQFVRAEAPIAPEEAPEPAGEPSPTVEADPAADALPVPPDDPIPNRPHRHRAIRVEAPSPRRDGARLRRDRPSRRTTRWRAACLVTAN